MLQITQIKQGLSFITTNKVYTSTYKTTIVSIEMELFFFFLPRVDASHVYIHALVLGCFYSHIYYYLNLSEGTDHVAGQLRGDKECPFSGLTKSDRVWRKVQERGARSVGVDQ